MIDILITVNTFVHDFASAMFLAGVIILAILAKEVEKQQSKETLGLYRTVSGKFSPLILISLVLIIICGVIRLIYYDYQIPADFARTRVNILVIKHILLSVIVGYGIYLHFKLKKRLNDIND